MISAIYKMVITIVDDCSVIVIATLCSHCYGLFQSLLSTVTKGTYNYDDDDDDDDLLLLLLFFLLLSLVLLLLMFIVI